MIGSQMGFIWGGKAKAHRAGARKGCLSGGPKPLAEDRIGPKCWAEAEPADGGGLQGRVQEQRGRLLLTRPD